MGKVVVHEFVTLDGIFEAPAWTAPYGFTDAMSEVVGSWTGGASALLLGRATFEMFAPAWSTRGADEPGVAFFNDSTKHVVTSTLEDAEAVWANSTTLAYDPQAIADLKASEPGDLYVSGSGRLVRALLAEGLVDELHLLTYPLVKGTGARLFPEGTPELGLALVDQRAFDNGVALLTYGPAAG